MFNAGPGYEEARAHKIIYHPATGLCVKRRSMLEPLELGSCSEAESWSYSPEMVLTVKGTYFCLQAEELGMPAKLGIICSDSGSKWEPISNSKMHLSSKLQDNTIVCLDVDSDNVIITSNCKCLSRDNSCDPGNQWFKIINSTRSRTTGNSFMQHIDRSFFYSLAKKLLGSFMSI